MTWPVDPICGSCYVRAVETFGTCASCAYDGMVPGLDENGDPICRVCARIETDLGCVNCGLEADH